MSDIADQIEINRLNAEVESLKKALNEWVRENAPGGWVDTFRNQAREYAAEVERLKGVLGGIKRNADCGGDPMLFRWQTLSEITKALEAKP